MATIGRGPKEKVSNGVDILTDQIWLYNRYFKGSHFAQHQKSSAQSFLVLDTPNWCGLAKWETNHYYKVKEKSHREHRGAQR